MPKPYFQNNKELLHSIIRVDHAGEYGAIRIYQGQIDCSRSHDIKALLSHMLHQEEKHLAFFNAEIKARKTRPTILLPLWHVVGYILGCLTSVCGPKTTMLCTHAVEEVINEHYLDQVQALHDHANEKYLANKIEEFRLEELEHMDTAIARGSFDSPLHHVLYDVIKVGCRLAIALSKRV